MIKYLQCMLFLFFIFPLNAHSFEGMPEVPGNIIVPLNKTNIILANLRINVDDGYIVKSSFELNNISSKKEQISVGFPLQKDTLYKYLEPQYFRIESNDKSVPYSIKKSDEYDVPDIIDKYDYLYVWQLVINPKGSITINCSYEVNWHADDPRVNRRHISFNLEDASYWKGPTETARITFNLSGSTLRLLNKNKIKLNIEPDGYIIDDNKSIIWSFKDWEPNNNILIEVNPYSE